MSEQTAFDPATDFKPAQESAEFDPAVDFVPAEKPKDLRALATETAKRHGIDPALFHGLIAAESNWDPAADASKNFPDSHAFGLTQLQPATAQAMGVTDISDPEQQLEGGAKYLASLAHHFDGDWERAVAAYHDGPGKVDAEGITADTGRPYVDAVTNASLAAFKAQNAGFSPDDAAEALRRSQETGLGATWLAKNLPATRQQEAINKVKRALIDAPILASWMNQSPAHAAAAGGDVENLSILEWLAGVRRAPVRPEAVGPYAQAQRDNPDLPNTEANPVDSLFGKALGQGAILVKATAMGITEGIRRLYQSRNPYIAALTPGRGLVELARATDAALTPEGVQRESTARYGGVPSSSEPQTEDARRADADQTIRETMDAAQIPIEGNEGPVRGAITESVRAVPQMVALMAGGASVLAAQSYGDLHNHFSLAQNPDGSRKYTEDEAQGLASGGAVATSILLSRLGPAFAENTVGRLLPKAAADGVGESGQLAFVKNLLESKSLWDNLAGRGAEFTEHAIHGAAFMAGQALVNDLTDQTGDVLHGGKYSASRSWDVAKGAAKDSLMLLPLMAIGPVRGIMEDTGRRWNAHQDAVHFASTVETAKNTKIIQTAPEEVQPLVEAQTRQNPERSTAFIPVAAFDAAMRQAGLDPAEVAGSFADQGAAYGEARASGGDFAVPMAEVATKLAPQGLADGLTADVKLRPDGMSLREALSIEEARKLYASMPGDADIGLSIPLAADLQEAQARKIYGATGEQATTPDRIRTPEAANPATDPFKAVYEDFKLRALAAGQTEEQADASAKVFTRGMAALARGEGRGRDVRQFAESVPAAPGEELLGGDGVARAEADVAAEQARTPETPTAPREEPLVRVDENHTMTATEFARRRTQSELPLGEVHPARYEQQARSAATEARKHNERAVNALSDAEAHAQEGLEAGSAAAEQARIAARSIAFGMGMQANSETPRAGMEALKNARSGLRESERGQQGAEDASVRATRAAIAAGDARTKATAAEQQQIVNDRLAAGAREAKAEQKKITGYMKERAGEDKRALLLRADQEYGQGSVYTDTHDAIMEALGFREPSGQPKSVDAGIARIDADDRLNFDPEALRAILAKPAVRQMGLNEKLKGSLDGLTLDEAKVVRDAIKNIRHAANAAVKVVLAEREAEYSDQVRRLGEFRPEKPPPALPPAGGRGAKSFFERVGETKRAIEGGFLYGDVILREAGPVGAEYAKEELRTHALRDELNRTVGAELRKAIDAMPEEVRKHLDDSIEGPPNPVLSRWTRKEAIMLGAWTGTASSAERAAKGLGITEEQLHAFLDVLTKPEWDFIQSAIWDVNDRVLKPLLLEHTAKNTGVPMETIEARPVQTKFGQYRGGFHHAAYNFEASQKQAARSQAEMGGIGDNYGDLKKGWAVGVRKGFTKSRADGFFDVPDLSWGSYPAHVNAVLHYLAVDNYVKALGGLLRRGDARAALTRTIGPEKLRKLDSHVEVVARGYAEGPRDGFKEGDNLLNGALRSRAAQGIFNFNLKVWAEQPTHILAAASTLGLSPRAVLVGSAKATFGGMAELARVGAEHIAVGLGEALQPYSWAAARERSAATGFNVLGRRWDNFTEHMRDMYAGVLPSGKKAGPWDIFNWGVQHGIDGFLSQVMWHASDYKARKAGATPEEAALIAEQNTYDAMPRMTAAEGSAYSASRGFIGTYILTKRFAATLFNLHELGTWEQKAKAFDASRGFQRAVGIVGYGMMSVALWQAQTFGAHVVGQFMAGHGAQDNESWIQWLVRKWIEGNGYSIPFGEDITKPIAEKLVHGKQLRAAIEPPASLRLIEDEINDIGLAIQSGKPVSDRMFAGTRSLLRAVPGGAGFIQPLKLGQAGYGARSARGPFDFMSKAAYPQMSRNKPREANIFSMISRARGE